MSTVVELQNCSHCVSTDESNWCPLEASAFGSESGPHTTIQKEVIPTVQRSKSLSFAGTCQFWKINLHTVPQRIVMLSLFVHSSGLA